MDMESYVDTLLCIYAELESEIKKEESVKIRNVLLFNKDLVGNMRKNIRRNKITPTKIYQDLFSIEIGLRQVWDSKGYKTKRAEDPRSALGR